MYRIKRELKGYEDLITIPCLYTSGWINETIKLARKLQITPQEATAHPQFKKIVDQYQLTLHNAIIIEKIKLVVDH